MAITSTEAADTDPALGIRPPSGFDEVSAPYFTEEIRRLLVDRFGSDTLYGGGLSVRSTLDSVLQKKAERACERGWKRWMTRRMARPLGRIDQAAELDAHLAEYTNALPDLRYAALVTEVSDDRAQIM